MYLWNQWTLNCSKEDFDNEISAKMENNILLTISTGYESNWLELKKKIIQNWFWHKNQ